VGEERCFLLIFLRLVRSWRWERPGRISIEDGKPIDESEYMLPSSLSKRTLSRVEWSRAAVDRAELTANPPSPFFPFLPPPLHSIRSFQAQQPTPPSPSIALSTSNSSFLPSDQHFGICSSSSWKWERRFSSDGDFVSDLSVFPFSPRRSCADGLVFF